jgi:hypothetical protein
VIPIALKKYRGARLRAQLRHIWSLLTGSTRSLLDLEAIRQARTVRGTHYAGMRTVPIAKIRGSMGRSDDFDIAFDPIKSHNRWRWLNIAAARQKGVALPLVELIQVGDVFFVEDGHHRISVARAWGQDSIDAEVIVWDVEEPLPQKRHCRLAVGICILTCQQTRQAHTTAVGRRAFLERTRPARSL